MIARRIFRLEHDHGPVPGKARCQRKASDTGTDHKKVCASDLASCHCCLYPKSVDPYSVYIRGRGSSKQMDITGKKVLLTGGSAGIGRALALQLREAGADVTIT